MTKPFKEIVIRGLKGAHKGCVDREMRTDTSIAGQKFLLSLLLLLLLLLLLAGPAFGHLGLLSTQRGRHTVPYGEFGRTQSAGLEAWGPKGLW